MLRLRFDDFTRATRSHTLPEATAADADRSSPRARGLLAAATPLDRGAAASRWSASRSRNLEDDGAIQLALPFERRPTDALDAALDDVRDRFGSAAITRAVLLGRDGGLVMPLLPD